MTSVSVVIISKNEAALAETLAGLRDLRTQHEVETVVVDASEGRLDHLDQGVRWVPFEAKPGKTITIPEQRNLGVAHAVGDVIAFIDAGCAPEPAWLDALVGPIVSGEQSVTVGRTLGTGKGAVYEPLIGEERELEEAPTINLAFTRNAFLSVNGFDEDFDYGSDIDFTWRLHDRGHRLWFVPSAVITHDWGNGRRQLRRAYRYGAARARLYTKHAHRIPAGLRRDPVLFAYPVVILMMLGTVLRRFRWLPGLLLIPAFRARRSRPVLTVTEHLVYGAGALAFVASRGRRGR